MNGGLHNGNNPMVRQLTDSGKLEPVADGQKLEGLRLLFVEPSPEQLRDLSASVKASQIACRLLSPDYQPGIEQLRADILDLRSEVARDEGGSLERNEAVKVAVFPCSDVGQIQCAYSVVVMRSVYEPNIITSAGIIVKEALAEGVCELHDATLRRMVRDEEFHWSTCPLCVCIAPKTQLTIASDVMDNHILALQRTCPLDHHEHTNYAIEPTSEGYAAVDSPLTRQTGISLEETCWTRVREISEVAEGAISDRLVELAVYLDSNEPITGAPKHYTATCRVTRWPGDTPGEGPYMVLQNTGSEPIFMGLFPRRVR